VLALSNNEDQNNKSEADEKLSESLKKESANDSSVQAQADQANTGEIETKIKKQHHTGITQQIGLLSESNETAKKYSDVVNQYQQMRSRNNLAESGISQAFGSLLPKKTAEEDAKEQKEEDGWQTFKQSDDKK
jgi:hypothetical protein